MELEISYRHMESTPSIEEKIREKAAHITKFFDGDDVQVKWVCTVDGDRHNSEVNVHASHNVFHASAQDSDLYKTFDQVLKKIESQLRKKKEQVRDHIHHKHD